MVAEAYESGRRGDAAIGNIGCEIKQRLVLAGVAIMILDADAGGAASAGRALIEITAAIERTERDFVDVLAGAGQEDVEDRERAVELLLLQIDFHILGDKKAEAQR